MGNSVTYITHLPIYSITFSRVPRRHKKTFFPVRKKVDDEDDGRRSVGHHTLLAHLTG